MAFLRAPAPHSRWIQARYSSKAPEADPFVSYPGFRRKGYVGALSAQGLAELGKQGIVISDQVVQDLDIPIMSEALDLQDEVFNIADDLGIGKEVRAGVYSIRGAEYATGLAASFVPAGAVGAGAAVFGGVGGIAAAGVAAVVVVVLFDLFSSDDDEVAAKAALKRAQKSVLHLRDRLTVSDFAAEQDGVAVQENMAAAGITATPWKPVDPAPHVAAAATAKKLALFYRTLPSKLTPQSLALFESLANLARWQGILNVYGTLGYKQKAGIDNMFGTSAPRLPSQLAPKMKSEVASVAALTGAVREERKSSGSLLIAAGLAGIGLWYWKPALVLGAAAGIWRGAKSLAGRAVGKTKEVATEATEVVTLKGTGT